MKKNVAILLVFSCLAMNLGACSKSPSHDVDYELEDSMQEGVVGSTLAQFLNEEKWTESFSVTRDDGQTMEIEIDGEIKIPSVDHMSVIEVQVPFLDYSVTEEMAGPTKQDFTAFGAGEEMAIMGGRSRYISFRPEDDGAFHVPEEERGECLRYGFWENGWEQSPGNVCSISEEEAEEMAIQFLEKMGISVSYYQIEKKTGILWYRELYSGDPFMEDGYYFRYTLKDDLGNDLFTSFDNYVNIYEKISGNTYALNSKIEIYVVEEGVMEVGFENAVQVVGVTKVQNYLSFDAIKQSLRKVLSEDFDSVYIPRDNQEQSETLILNSIELIYFRIRDKEQDNDYSYIPVWQFCHHTETGGELIDDTVYHPILINALDGSVIRLEDEF